MSNNRKFIIGSRGSKLALIQANWAKSKLEEANKEKEFEIEIIKTKGDKILDTPLSRIGGMGLFTKELENALLEKKVDLVVHSAKDVPTEVPEGLMLSAFSKREDPHDVLISKGNLTLSGLPEKAKIGTSSLRRGAQLLAFRKDLELVDLRGNLDTRLKKLDSGELDAIVVARAGLIRLGMEDKASEIISSDIMLHAVGQGALCIETRDDDNVVEIMVKVLNHNETSFEVKAERAFLKKLKGGCQVPIGAHSELWYPVNLKLEGVICSLDGSTILRESTIAKLDDFEILGYELADKLLSMGGYQILEEIRKSLPQE